MIKINSNYTFETMTDFELAKVFTTDKAQYTPEAIDIAKQVFQSRSFNIEDASKVLKIETEKIAFKASSRTISTESRIRNEINEYPELAGYLPMSVGILTIFISLGVERNILRLGSISYGAVMIILAFGFKYLRHRVLGILLALFSLSYLIFVYIMYDYNYKVTPLFVLWSFATFVEGLLYAMFLRKRK